MALSPHRLSSLSPHCSPIGWASLLSIFTDRTPAAPRDYTTSRSPHSKLQHQANSECAAAQSLFYTLKGRASWGVEATELKGYRLFS